MACNHAAYLFLDPGTMLYGLLTAVGYFTAPCMCFFLAEGFDRTSNRKRYLMRLLFWACLSQPVYSLAIGGGLNMLFTLSVCLLVLEASMLQDKVMRCMICGVFILATAWMDWPVLAPVFTLLFYYETGLLPFLLSYLFYVLISILVMGAGFNAFLYGIPILISGMILTRMYNGKKGNVPKWFFYLFYPAHLILLYLIKLFIR